MLFVVLIYLGACSDSVTAPEQEIRAWLEQGQEAVEAKRRRELAAMVSPAYADGRGKDRDDLETMLRIYFLRQNTISLVTSIEDIRVFGDSAAEVEMTVGMGGTNDGALGFSASAYRFSLELQRDDDDWKLISAMWGRLGDELY